jgi:hypothetical protein
MEASAEDNMQQLSEFDSSQIKAMGRFGEEESYRHG